MRAACSCLGRHGCVSVHLSWLWSDQWWDSEEVNTHFSALKHEAGKWNFHFSCWEPKSDVCISGQGENLPGCLSYRKYLGKWEAFLADDPGKWLVSPGCCWKWRWSKGKAVEHRSALKGFLFWWPSGGNFQFTPRGNTKNGVWVLPTLNEDSLWGFSSLSKASVVPCCSDRSVSAGGCAHRPPPDGQCRAIPSARPSLRNGMAARRELRTACTHRCAFLLLLHRICCALAGARVVRALWKCTVRGWNQAVLRGKVSFKKHLKWMIFYHKIFSVFTAWQICTSPLI